MTDEASAPDGTAEIPDGYLILHRNADTRFGIGGYYALGPYPPFLELVEFLKDQTACDCTKSVLPCYFPNGVSMSATIGDTDHDHLPALPLPGMDRAN